MADDKKNQDTEYKFPADINVIETSDPKDMYGKYLYEAAVKKWTEDFLDNDTKEIVSVERNEVIMERGTYIDQDVLQQLMFSIQANEIEKVKVCNEFIMKRETVTKNAYEVTMTGSAGGSARVWVGACHTPEEAVEIVSDWCAFYCPETIYGQFTISDATISSHETIDDCLRVVTDGQALWKVANIDRLKASNSMELSYWSVKLRYMYTEFDNWKKIDYMLIVKAYSADNAANIVMDWARFALNYTDETLIMVEAVKKSKVTDVIPTEYRKQWHKKHTEEKTDEK